MDKKISKGTSLSYPETGNDLCRDLEEHSHWFNARNEVIRQTMEWYPFQGDFLDLGGGNGYQLAYLQSRIFHPKGIRSALCEPGVSGCTHAAARGISDIFRGTHRDFPFGEWRIGGIGLFDVLEHIEDDVQLLRELAEVLPPGGRLYITVPAMRSLWSVEDELSGHFRRFNTQEERRLVQGTSLKVIQSYYFFAYYVPLVWMLRVLPERLGLVSGSPEDVASREQGYHRTGRITNVVLERFHLLELWALRQGFRPFWGTSRMLVLEKG